MDTETAPSFARTICSACKLRHTVAIIKILDGRLCFMCYGLVKKASNLDLDGVQALSLAKVMSFIERMEAV